MELYSPPRVEVYSLFGLRSLEPFRTTLGASKRFMGLEGQGVNRRLMWHLKSRLRHDKQS